MFLPAIAYASISIHDVTGRAVTKIQHGMMTAEEKCIVWGGCDESGLSVPDGVYMVRMESTGQAVAGKLVLLQYNVLPAHFGMTPCSGCFWN